MIFGIGLNQLSDYFEERVTFTDNPTARTMCGSLAAGVLSGYLSHIPHNLSTLKLLNPGQTYSQLFRTLTGHVTEKLPPSLPPRVAKVSACNTCALPEAQLRLMTPASVCGHRWCNPCAQSSCVSYCPGMTCRLNYFQCKRGLQIMGSFAIINGTMSALRDVDVLSKVTSLAK